MALPMRVPRESTPGSMESAWRDFNSMLSRFFGERGLYEEGEAIAPYGIDVREDDQHIYVEAELPGFNKDEVNISLENQTLTIMAEKKQRAEEQKTGDFLLRERRYTRFIRSLTLPSTVNEQQVDAKLESGVLKITLNKRPEAQPKKIEVH